jgi:hypothetical protein
MQATAARRSYSQTDVLIVEDTGIIANYENSNYDHRRG